ncbi:alkylated DNA repair protein ALKBH8 homolog isoform X3 [Juglans microcarpa x Juglans regia]|uniref:alkylated DNA repair protein ALKBH8 homolog isoform X3 n=1 Tax=Juglans microcarpa x Juglans regia TaxID=2249226 RepID=UPI001B7E0208|nr:alkylated DNA repair protein ALKBH8 homolog isoform X3 [Juglans microcarpa x Juglans regia]
MGLPRFGRPKGFEGDSSPNLYVANCGPAVGLSYDSIASVFSAFGELKGVFAADDSGARVIVSYRDESSATAALEAFDGHPCPDLGGRSLHIRYSVLQPTSQGQVSDSVPVSLMASELNIPGLYLLQDFVTIKEEEELLAAIDARPWKSLSKRRVQHYGYEFCYETRNVNTRRKLGELPSFVSLILERISSFPNLDDSANIVLDQLTVNEYPTGVGLSPHVDTHSAFEGFIFSLSLAGPCIMEFRQYAECAWLPNHTSSPSMKMQSPEDDKSFLRRAIYLPPRSMLLLSGEARYAWHHYIPHHKIDLVKDSVIRRGSRRVSFTFRKVRTVLANVNFPSIVIPRDEKTGFILVENQSRTIQCSSVYVPTIIIVCRKSLVLSLDSRATRLELDSLSKMIHSPSFRGSHRLFLRLTGPEQGADIGKLEEVARC